jgi:nucleotide-binding universal stress UspA family protein
LDLTDEPLFRGVFLPTDYSEAGQLAFFHALKLAQVARVPLRLMHVEPPDSITSWSHFPKVRETLTRWLGRSEILTSDDLRELGLAVRKSVAKNEDPAKAILKGLESHRDQLLVVAPHAHEGWGGMFHRSLSQELARRSRLVTLFVPEGSWPFVNPEDGRLELKRVLFPVDVAPSPQGALDQVEGLADLLELEEVVGVLLHVGNREIQSSRSVHPRWRWASQQVEGEPVSQILEVARRENVHLIAMATEGRQGLTDAFRGSMTERVIRGAPCPVLAVHVGG